MQNDNILIVIAVWFLVLFELWDKSYNIRKKTYYKVKKLLRPIFIYIGGLNERERVKRETRASQFRNQIDAEESRREKKSYRNTKEVERSRKGIIESDNSGRERLEIIERARWKQWDWIAKDERFVNEHHSLWYK